MIRKFISTVSFIPIIVALSLALKMVNNTTITGAMETDLASTDVMALDVAHIQLDDGEEEKEGQTVNASASEEQVGNTAAASASASSSSSISSSSKRSSSSIGIDESATTLKKAKKDRKKKELPDCLLDFKPEDITKVVCKVEVISLGKNKDPEEINLAQYIQVSDDVIVYLNKRVEDGGLNLEQLRVLCLKAKVSGIGSCNTTQCRKALALKLDYHYQAKAKKVDPDSGIGVKLLISA